MPQPITLDQIFGAFVRQDSLEEAAFDMAALARRHPELLEEIGAALRQAIHSNAGDEPSVVDAVHCSGYYVADAAEAKKYCVELLELFLGHIANGP
jgi:hypothetical protein